MHETLRRVLLPLCLAMSCGAWAGSFTTASVGDASIPVLTVEPAAVSITALGATISWSTDRLTDSRVYFGTAMPLANVAGDIEYVAAHSVQLTKLSENTTYHYQVVSVDPSGNRKVSSIYSFHTPVHAAGTPVVDWPAPPAITFGTALSGAQLNATANVAGNFTYTPPFGSMLNAGTHTLSVDFMPSDSVHYNPVVGTKVTLVVNKAGQTIDFPNPGTQYGGVELTLTASASSGFEPTFSSLTLMVCMLTEFRKVTFIAPGTCTIQADQAGSVNFLAAPSVRVSFAVVAPAIPTARTTSATNVGPGGATLNGSVNANGASADVSFEYGKTTAYGASAAATPSTIGAAAGSTVLLTISGLSCNTVYHFQLNASNRVGTAKGGDQNFLTAPCVGTAPGAPAINFVTYRGGRLVISITPPANDGGNPILGYTASCVAPGRPERSGSAISSPVTVSGMTAGVRYSCTVRAANAVGEGAFSPPNLVVPRSNALSEVIQLLID